MLVIFQNFGVQVLGLDLSDNMVEMAMERAITEKLPSVRLNIHLNLLVQPPELVLLIKEISMRSTPGPV